MNRRLFVWSLVGTVLLVLVYVSIRLKEPTTTVPDQPAVLGKLPAFSLTNRDGRTITLASLAGKPWIADFIFTRCAGSCPLMTARMARLGQELSGDLRRVSITVDPAHDDAATLERYAAAAHAPADWLFLTGPAADLLSLSRDGFKLGIEMPAESPAGAEASAKEPIVHSTRFVLVDGEGRIRGYYDAFDAEAMGRLAKDWRQVGVEDRESGELGTR